MKNLKIRVNNEAEAEEVKRLAVKAGYTLDALFGKKWSSEFCYLVLCENMSAGFGNEIMADGDKPLSIGELWAMVVLKRNDVNDATHESSIYKYFKACDDWYYFDLGCTDKWQKSSGAKPEYYEKLKPIEKNMKEYLIPDRNYEYILTDAREALEPHAEDWIEIPDGMNFAYKDDMYTHFTKMEMGYRDAIIIWQREQDEPFLTPECTLNDQYAEIEQVRQVEIHGTVKANPDFNFGAAQAIKVKSGSDSDHAIDAMSFGIMGAGAAQASGGAKDNVNHPSHYADSAIECIDAMEAMMTPEQFIGYLRGNLFKYQWRYEKKNGIEDLKKAQWYLEKLTAKVAENNAPF